jgi:hypothetical protein
MAKKKGNGEQQELPGVLPEVVEIAALTRACKALKTAREEYQKAGMDARDANEHVKTLMHEHADKLRSEDGMPTYRSAGMTVRLKPGKETIEIKMGDEEPEEPVEGDVTVEDGDGVAATW